MNTRALELEFLPAALEIEETPPLPLARAMLWSIVLFLPIAIAWACIGTVDIVGTYLGSERALRAYLRIWGQSLPFAIRCVFGVSVRIWGQSLPFAIRRFIDVLHYRLACE